MKILVPLFCLFLSLVTGIVSCAPKQVPVKRPPEVVWNDFWAKSSSFTNKQGFMIQTSVNYTAADQRNRMLANIWGLVDYPVRMDLSTGFGHTFGIWMEDHLRWEAYFPGENARYVHHDGSRGATILGYPTPLNLRETAMVLLGFFEGLVPAYYQRVESRNQMWKYYFDDHRIQNLVLNQDGILQSVSGDGWQVEFKGPERYNGVFYFSRLDMRISRDKEAVIRIRSVDLDRDWEREQLILDLPGDTRTIFLY